VTINLDTVPLGTLVKLRCGTTAVLVPNGNCISHPYKLQGVDVPLTREGRQHSGGHQSCSFDVVDLIAKPESHNMRITREKAEQLLPILHAYAAGKTIQFKGAGSVWVDMKPPMTFESDPAAYRVKPEPKLRPWTADEIPVGAVIRRKGSTSLRYLIHGTATYGVDTPCAFVDRLHMAQTTPSRLLEHFEWRWPHETEWRPCGVVEDATGCA
jgi:hypothetical protein